MIINDNLAISFRFPEQSSTVAVNPTLLVDFLSLLVPWARSPQNPIVGSRSQRHLSEFKILIMSHIDIKIQFAS